jgi:hypothetical protein
VPGHVYMVVPIANSIEANFSTLGHNPNTNP